jgi:putative aldouronate transport system substrate-binding protein
MGKNKTNGGTERMKHIVKSVALLVLAATMIASAAACTASIAPVVSNAPVASDTPATSAASPTATSQPLEKIDVFDSYGNLTQGVDAGWWAKVVQDKFGLQLNMICPNVAGGGDTLYQTRVAAGNLADLFSISDAKMSDCINGGLVMDITSLIQGKQNLAKFDVATKNTCATLGTGDKVYAIAEAASLLPPTTPSFDGGNPNFGPYMRWDYYKELGYPTMNNYDDMLNVLKQMQANHPKSISGKKTYGISLFKDWDGSYMAFTAKFAYMYGYKEMNDDFIFINQDATKQVLITDENGPYYKALQMLYKANQMGLLDPDAPSNTWNSLADKVKDGQILCQPWPWNSVDGVNTTDLGNKGQGFALVPVNDMTLLADGQNPYGGGSAFGIGSKAKDPQRIIDFLDWYASPEGLWFTTNGPEGLVWELKDGKPVLTEYGKTAAAKKSPVPAEYGGGNWVDGGCPINGFAEPQNDICPTYNETYQSNRWASTIAANQTALTLDWNTHMGATSVLDYLQKNNKLVVAPGNTYVRPSESSIMTTEKTQCATAIKTASWQMIFAKNQSQFDSIWNDMKKQLDGFGYQDVLKTEQTYVEGYRAAIAQTLKDTGAGQ